MERSKVGLLLAKAETTYGVDPTPVATANNIAVVRGAVNIEFPSEIIDRDILDAGFGKGIGHNVKQHGRISFRTELRGNRTTGSVADISSGLIANALEIDPLFRACDMAATYTAESAGGARDGYVTYKPTFPVDRGTSLTFYFYSEGKLYRVSGAKGDFSISLEGGKMGYIDWSFTGLFSAPIDSSIPGSITWLTTKPPLFERRAAYPTAQAVTITNATDLVNLSVNALENGDLVKFNAVAMPAPLVADTWYYVRDRTINNFKVAATPGGAAIDLTSDGTTVTMTSLGAMAFGAFQGPVFSRLNLKLGNSIVMQDDANSIFGVNGFIKTDRVSSGDFDPESVKEATHPFWVKWSSRLVQELHAIVGTNSTSGNRFHLFAKTAIDRLQYEDRAGRRIQNCQFAIRNQDIGETPGSEFSLRFF